MEKRKYPRISTDVTVKFRANQVDDSTKGYLHGIAEDCGLGGVFLATSHIFTKGDIISLIFSFHQDHEEVVIKARAVVRWTRRLRKPKGMGLEFFEFEGLSHRDFQRCMDRLVAAE